MPKPVLSFGIIFLVVVIETSGLLLLESFCDKKASENQQQYLYENEIATAVTQELQYFPIPIKYQNRITYTDTYGIARPSGMHEGCDIMDKENCSGEIPIISATDGTVTNLGWLYLGGYRIGITSETGLYYYYAHLHSYAAGLAVGDKVQAGEFLGFMGDTGEGEEGTSGNFPVHLHFGIYITLDSSNEQSLNPYPYLLDLQ